MSRIRSTSSAVESTYVTGDSFVFRTPRLPFEAYLALSEGLATPNAATRASLAADRATVRARLRELADRPEVRAALFVASPSLDESLEHWRRDPDSDRGQKAELTLLRYVARMCGRATPFGLFSGCATGAIARDTKLEVGLAKDARRHSRLDTDYLFALCEALGRDPDVRASLTYRPNSSLYRAGGRVRYAAAKLEGNARRYELVALEPTTYLDAILARASRGGRVEDFVALLCEMDGEISRAEAIDFVAELIDAQVLVSELAPAVTGLEPTRELVDRLGAIEATRAAAERLDQVDEALHALDREGPSAPPERYRQLARQLESHPAKAELARLFQVDVYTHATEATLGGAPLREIARAVELLHRIMPYEDPLADVTRAFADRYGGEEVPLLVALDEEIGLGFATSTAPAASAEPLLAGLPFPIGGVVHKVGLREQHLRRLLDEALRTGAQSIALTDADIDALAVEDRPPLADAVSVTATIAARSPAAIARGEFSVLIGGVAGPSGVNLLGRFCHGDAGVRAQVEAPHRAEEERTPHPKVAEVVHHPEGR
ncbi:MAG: lantibiotic dehydratase family protein, partial [Polyangiales bacterium]